MAEEKERTIPEDLRDVDEQSPVVVEAIQQLRTMIEEEGLHMKTNDRRLLRHLYPEKFDAELAFRKLKDHFKLKKEYPQWFPSKPIKEYKEILDNQTHVVLPFRDRRGKRIMLVKMGNINHSNMTTEDMSILDEICLESIADEEETQRCGTMTITDMSGYSLRSLTWLTPSNLAVASKKAHCDFFSNRHEHHNINSSMVMNAAVALMFPLVNEDLKKLIFFHYSDYEALHKFVDPAHLPEEYGGTGPPIDYATLQKQFFYDKEDELLEAFQEGYAADE